MELNLTQPMKQIISAFILIILPLIVLALGTIFGIENAWYYLLSIVWFGTGIIFFGAIY